MRRYFYLFLLGAALLTSCKTPTNITYLQDVYENVPIKTQGDGYIRFMPGDKLSIYVHSRDEKLMELFNLSGRNGGGNTMMAGGQNYAPYTVDDNGDIDFPVLGSLHIEGLTRDEVQKMIKNELIGQSLCKDPIVTVAFYNMNFSVLGSAGTGLKAINKDRITILEAIAMGELDISGLRKNVLVMRTTRSLTAWTSPVRSASITPPSITSVRTMSSTSSPTTWPSATVRSWAAVPTSPASGSA